MKDAEIRAVLDASAMLSYATAHVHVGEVMVEVNEDGGIVAVPAVALLDAQARLTGDNTGQARLGVLTTLPGVEVLELAAVQARAAAAMVSLAQGDLSRAHAAWAALRYGAYFLTAEPGLVPAIVQDVIVIPKSDDGQAPTRAARAGRRGAPGRRG